MDIHDVYKPLRNQLRRLALRESLERIWWLQRRADSGGQIVLSGAGGQRYEIHVWELHLLSREILLHADGDEDLLSTLNGVLTLINHIRRIDEAIAERTIDSGDSAMDSLHPLVHLQVRCQHPNHGAAIFRAYHIYGAPDVAQMVEQAVGLPVPAIFTLALILGGAAIRGPYSSPVQDYSAFGVSDEMRDAFFQRIAGTPEGIRTELRAVQRFDEAWQYTWNALEKFPLVRVDVDGTRGLCCPLPDFLFRRVTEGLFYDVVGSDRRFGDRYGRAFQDYVGKVLGEVFNNERFTLESERTYSVRKQPRHGVDWIVSDGTGNLFLECKARRMAQPAKEVVDSHALEASIDDLARAVVQHYRNIHDAVQGLSAWMPNSLPIYPVVVTYEDWYLFTPSVIEQLNLAVRRHLSEKGLSSDLPETMPFLVTSIAEFEKAGQAIARIGIKRFCTARGLNEHRHFKLSGFAGVAFPDEEIDYKPLLQTTWRSMFSHVPEVLSQLVSVGI